MNDKQQEIIDKLNKDNEALNQGHNSMVINVNLKMYSFDHLRMYNIDHINTFCSRR